MRQEALHRHGEEDVMTPPLFPELKPVRPDDRDFIKDRLDARPFGICEMNFANILIWEDSERPRYTMIHDSLCILVEPTFEPAYFLPPVGGSDLEKTIATCLAVAPRLSRVPEEIAQTCGASFRVEEDRDNFDYVYLARDLAELTGKKYDGKRNRIRKFESGFDHAYEGLQREHTEDCRRLLLRWFEEKGNGDPHMKAEKDAILKALSMFDDLGLVGGVVKVAGRVEAFSIGMRLSDDTAVIQIEIANPAFPGLAQWINREFVRREWTAYRFINREQDMGMPGLRSAKLSYQPHHLVKKFNLFKP
jgi:hypothetical protein